MVDLEVVENKKNIMKQFLVKYDNNYADEFDLEGFYVMEGESKKDIQKQLLCTEYDEEGEKTGEEFTNFPFERYFGSNECIEYEDKKDYLSCFTIEEITLEESNVLNKLFGGGFGDFLTVGD
jgi:hypothetical protein